MKPKVFHFQASDGSRLPYVVHLPPGHDRSARRWPLVLFLHGAMERGEDPRVLCGTGLPAEILRRPDYPAVMLAPQCSAHTTWLDHVVTLLELLDALPAAWRVDPRRVHLTGLSLGGMGAWLLGATAPSRFASVVPICGSVPPRPGFPAAVGALKDTPVWAFHGVQDPVIPVQSTLTLVGALKRAGGHPRLTLYADVGHRAWEPAYADPDLTAWFTGPGGVQACRV